jgi:hypothetical protein
MSTAKTRAVLMNVNLFIIFCQCNTHAIYYTGVTGWIVSMALLFLCRFSLLGLNSYDFFKTTLLQYPIPLVNYQFHDGLFLHVVASLGAGTCGTS